MMVILGLVVCLYIGCMTVTSDSVEITMYVRTSGKKIALGIHQERRHSSFQDTINIELSFFILFLTFTFTRYR